METTMVIGTLLAVVLALTASGLGIWILWTGNYALLLPLETEDEISLSPDVRGKEVIPEVVYWPVQTPDYDYSVAAIHGQKGQMANIAIAGH